MCSRTVRLVDMFHTSDTGTHVTVLCMCVCMLNYVPQTTSLVPLMMIVALQQSLQSAGLFSNVPPSYLPPASPVHWLPLGHPGVQTWGGWGGEVLVCKVVNNKMLTVLGLIW